MKLGTFGIAAGTLAVGLAMWTPSLQAQPMWDVVHVNLPYTVTIGDKTLQPGEYTIEQSRDMGGAGRVMRIYSDNGMKFETSAMTIPAVDPNTARTTEVVLHHIGSDYYFGKIWVQGKDYGYEFPLPARVKDREKELQMSDVTVPARYSTQSKTDSQNTAAAQPATTTTDQQTTAASTPPPPPPPPTETADQTSTPPNPPQSTTPQPAAASTDDSNNSANRSMPNTSAGWLMMLLGGGSLSGIGMALRRKR